MRLAERADGLSSGRGLPLDLDPVCSELSVRVRVAARRAGQPRGCLERDGARSTIVLFRAPGTAAPSPTRAERFTLAHELAHAVIDQEADFAPRRRAEYWRLEELCNEFASRLLIPQSVRHAVVSRPRDADELAVVIDRVVRLCGVTAEPAARAVLPRMAAAVAAGGIHLDPHPHSGRLAFRMWWVEHRPSHVISEAPRIAIYGNHPLAPLVVRMRALPVGEPARSPRISGTTSTWFRRRRQQLGSVAALLEPAAA